MSRIVKVGDLQTKNNITYQKRKVVALKIQDYNVVGNPLPGHKLKNVLNKLFTKSKRPTNYRIQVEAYFENVGWRSSSAVLPDEEISVWNPIEYDVNIDPGDITEFCINYLHI
jgi:hypothetical protein